MNAIQEATLDGFFYKARFRADCMPGGAHDGVFYSYGWKGECAVKAVLTKKAERRFRFTVERRDSIDATPRDLGDALVAIQAEQGLLLSSYQLINPHSVADRLLHRMYGRVTTELKKPEVIIPNVTIPVFAVAELERDELMKSRDGKTPCAPFERVRIGEQTAYVGQLTALKGLRGQAAYERLLKLRPELLDLLQGKDVFIHPDGKYAIGDGVIPAAALTERVGEKEMKHCYSRMIGVDLVIGGCGLSLK
jgi:hypothetical protein